MSQGDGRVYAIGETEIDLSARQIRHRGVVVAVEPQVFDLIALLTDRHGQVVSKDEIIEQVWGGRIVTDSSISARIAAARKALGDDGARQQIIKTVHSRGFILSVKAEAREAPTAPPGFDDRPAIAVLAFTNMGEDPEQEFLADGISEDVLIRLAMWRWLPVIARTSSFAYKGKSVDVKNIGRELGAKYVLEGGVRRAGNRVRVTAQLIDTETGRHVWAERYDREIVDIFALQDEITDAVVAALEPAVGRAEMLRAQRQTPSDVDAWAHFQQGMSQLTKATREGLAAAKIFFRRSAGIDPTFARPLAAIAIANFIENTIGYSENGLENMTDAHLMAQEAIALDDLEPFAHAGLAYASFMNGGHDSAVAAGRRAVELNPSFALGYHALAAALYAYGDQDGAIEAVTTAIGISPSDPFCFLFLGVLSASHYLKGEYDEAARVAGRGVQRFPWYASTHRWNAMALAQLGRDDEASTAREEFLRLALKFDVATAEQSYRFRQKRDLDHYLEGLRKAGLLQ